MKIRFRPCCLMLLVAVVFQSNSALPAQDVAAAARANRANHNNAALAKADSQKPLTDTELMAMISGRVLDENIVRAIQSRGLAFQPTEQYRSLATTAGAGTKVLDALKNPKVASGSATTLNSSVERLAKAGHLMQQADYDGASVQLTAALQAGSRAEAAFVMGQSLREQERWAEAAALYAQIVDHAPEFQAAHTKLSYIFYKLDDFESGLREAEAAISQDAGDAEAHKNAGLAFDGLRKPTAAEQEYAAALRAKPDYAAVRYDLGNLYSDQGQYDRAIEEYKKAIALNPKQEGVYNNLGNAYENKGDIDAAVRTYREAKRVDPNDLQVRQDLGGALMQLRAYPEAVLEFKELVAMAPDSPVCHDCFGSALLNTWDFDGAEKQYRQALQLDPTDSFAHFGIGNVRIQQKDYDGAVEEYRQAERLDPSYAPAYREAGRAYLAKKDLPNALKELKQAENLQPSNGITHYLYAQAQEASGNHSGAIAEFQEALAIDPQGNQAAMLELAAAYENNGNFADALNMYRQAALGDSSDETQNKCKAAQERLEKKLAATPGASEALKASLRAPVASTSNKLDAAMQAGVKANSQQHWDEAEAHYKEAVQLAEQMQPHDLRLSTSLTHLADLYVARRDLPLAEATYQKNLKVIEELGGPENSMMADPLQALGRFALMKQDFATANDYFSRATAITEKTYGENSDKVAMSLINAAVVPMLQKQYEQAETMLLRAIRIDEALYGKDNAVGMAPPVNSLCDLYRRWDRPDKEEPCDERLNSLLEKQFGANSPVLAQSLTEQAQLLRKLGRIQEATQIEQRVQTINTVK
jgi:tetratricopeptide (TPR) repeat protein